MRSELDRKQLWYDLEGMVQLPDSEQAVLEVPPEQLVAIGSTEKQPVTTEELEAARKFLTAHSIETLDMEDYEVVELYRRLRRV